MSHNYAYKRRKKKTTDLNKQAKWSRKVRSRDGYRCDNPYTNTEHYLWWDRAFRYEQQQTTPKTYYQEF